jgi:hypothetical protein
MLQIAEVIDTRKAFKTGQKDDNGNRLFKGAIEVRIGGKKGIFNTVDNVYAAPAFFNKRIPLVGEQVFIFKGMSTEKHDARQKTVDFYYFTLVNVIDDVTLQTMPFNFQRDAINNGKNPLRPAPPGIADFKQIGYTIKKNPSTSKMLQPFEGDDLWEGRFGQSIRFTRHGGFSYPPGPGIYEKNSLTYWPGAKENDPLMIIKVKKPESGNSYDIEDISKDAASIYLTTSQKLLKFKGASSKNLDVKLAPTWSGGSQIVIDADRVIINAKKNKAFLVGKEQSVVTGKKVLLQSDKYKVDLDDLMDWINSAYAEFWKLATAQMQYLTAMGPTAASTNVAQITKIHKVDWNLKFKKPV